MFNSDLVPQFFASWDRIPEEVINSSEFIDIFDFQAKELFEIGCNIDKDEYVFVFFSWRKCLLRCVKEDFYFELLTNRNRNIINLAEQKRLYFTAKVCVLGLSVGSSIVKSLVQSGISRRLILSDFDFISTTNLNRIQTSVLSIGAPKSEVITKEVFEINPFIKINLLPEGIALDTLEKKVFSQRPTIIFDEIDDLVIKIALRRAASYYKVPVIMLTDNGDGVIFHIERYDLEYNQILGYEKDFWDQIDFKGMDRKSASNFIVENIVGGKEFVDEKMIHSLEALSKGELASWPQVGTATSLAGSVATFIIKEIGNGGFLESNLIRGRLSLGRYEQY